VATKTELPVQVFRDRLSEHMERVVYMGERFVVTRNGKPRAALVSIDDLKRLEDTDAKQPQPKRRQ
jgi:prevent-host-death family protein